MAMPRANLTEEEKNACVLLDMLDDTRTKRLENGEEAITIKTPALSLFLEETQKFTKEAFNNIKSYERVIDEHEDHVREVTSVKIKGCRGQLASNLISFALTGAWSIVSQNYVTHDKKQHKIPIITTKEILEQLVWTRVQVQRMIVEEHLDIDDPDIQEVIKAFQNHLMVSQQEYMDEYPDEHDYNNLFIKVVSLKELKKNPYKIHKKWEYFFTTDEKPNIDKLIEDIKIALNFYKKKHCIDSKRENALTDTEKLLETSTTLAKGTEYVNREKEIKLLKNVSEKCGDELQNEKFKNAESANAKKFQYEMSVNHTNNLMKRRINSFEYEDDNDNDRFTKRVKRYLDEKEDDPIQRILNKKSHNVLEEIPDI